MTAPLSASIMNTQANQKHSSPGDVKDLKSLYAQSFALVTPANKDADGSNLLVPIKKTAVGSNYASKPDSAIEQPCIVSSNAEIEQNCSPISHLTHMDTKEYFFDNIDPLPYDQDEQIALHGSLGNHFLDMMNSPIQPPSNDELQESDMFQANDLEDNEQMPNLPEVEVMSASSPHPLPFYPPPHWPIPMIFQGQGPPHPYFVYCNYGYAYPDDHSAISTPILHPKPPTNHSAASRRFDTPLLASGDDDQEFIQEVTDNDVICGRGGAINNHPGNKRFREFINEFKYAYLHESKQKKPKVAMRVLELVKQSNPPGRFLKKFPEGYLECSEDRAKEKASQALREGAAKLRKEGCGDENKEGQLGCGPLVVKSIVLPNERARGDRSGYADDAKYCDQFEPPRPRKKSKKSA